MLWQRVDIEYASIVYFVFILLLAQLLSPLKKAKPFKHVVCKIVHRADSAASLALLILMGFRRHTCHIVLTYRLPKANDRLIHSNSSHTFIFAPRHLQFEGGSGRPAPRRSLILQIAALVASCLHRRVLPARSRLSMRGAFVPV